MKREKNIFLIYSMIIGLLLIAVCIIRASSTGITYDESYTYIKYVFDHPFYVFEYSFSGVKILANNHILNSFLISLFQSVLNVKYSIFLIRIPNILFYILFLFYAYKLCKRYNHKYLFFNILVFCYGINEFFGLARGYGIACALVLAGLYYLKLWTEDEKKYKYLNIAYLLLMISCYANTVSLIPFASIILFSQLYILLNKGIKENINYLIHNWYKLLPIIITTVLIIIYHFNVSADKMPLYGGNGTFLSDVLSSYLNVYGIYFHTEILAVIVVVFLMILVIIKRKSLLKINLMYISIIYFVFLIVSKYAFNQMWLTSRLLIPSIPLLFVSIFEIVDKIKIKSKVIMIILSAITVIPFARNLNITKTRDWEDNYIIGKKAYEAYAKKDNSIIKPYISNYTVYFYQEKIKAENNYDIFEDVK